MLIVIAYASIYHSEMRIWSKLNFPGHGTD